MSDSFFTISKRVDGIFNDRGSKFIGIAIPVENETEVKEILQKIKKEFPSANHYCYAYRLGINKQFRSNDDGEPSGSAGKPILGQLQSKDLSNVLLIVVRYFGGSLLGVPGLINAYKQAALITLEQASVIEKFLLEKYIVEYNFERTNEIMKILKDAESKIINQDFNDRQSIQFEIKKQNSLKLESQLNKLYDISFKKLTY
jgi:uncharacterized YigZ family protein